MLSYGKFPVGMSGSAELLATRGAGMPYQNNYYLYLVDGNCQHQTRRRNLSEFTVKSGEP